MPHVPSPDITGLVVRARIALRITQRELGERFGCSLRTAARWESGRSQPDNGQIHALARAVHPLDVPLAAALAAEGGTSLDALGLVVRPPPPAPAAPPPGPPARPFPPIALVLDSVLLAAMDAAEAHADSLRERAGVREVIHAAVARARALGLTLSEVDDALSAAAQGSPSDTRDDPPRVPGRRG